MVSVKIEEVICMLKFFIVSVLLLVLLRIKKQQEPNELYTVTFSLSPFVYDFIKALAVSLIVSFLTC